uniref:Transposase element L1Md-A101/L1Md-A102/L1Md-A2 n=1 Tax=Sander lucioperca TaxID=283035 RepID=A0A8C9YN82_SANLU
MNADGSSDGRRHGTHRTDSSHGPPKHDKQPYLRRSLLQRVRPHAKQRWRKKMTDFEGFKRELREDLVGAMKKEVRSVLESELGFFKSEVLSLKSGLEELKNTTNSEIAELRSTLAGAEHSLSTCSDDVTTLQRDVKRLTELADILQNKCEDLEGRSRRNNVRIVGIPESPGSCSTSAIPALLKDAFNLEKAPLVDRSHRSSQPAPRGGEPARTVMARLHYYKNCNDILRLARTKQKIQVDGMTISVYPDFTARVAKARAAFNGVGQMLTDAPGVKFGIIFPARLCITFNGAKSFFTDPEAARAYVSQNIVHHQED